MSNTTLTATVVAGLLDATPDGTLLVDADGRMLLVNSRVEELFGYPREELLGQLVEMLLPEPARDRHVEHRDEFVEHPRVRPMCSGRSLLARRRDGSEFPVEVSLSPLAADDGQWTVATVRDVTARLESERRVLDDALALEQTRIAEDLSETVIRALFGTGLQLQSLLELANGRVRSGLEDAIEQIDITIRDLRGAIFDLQRPPEPDA